MRFRKKETAQDVVVSCCILHNVRKIIDTPEKEYSEIACLFQNELSKRFCLQIYEKMIYLLHLKDWYNKMRNQVQFKTFQRIEFLFLCFYTIERKTKKNVRIVSNAQILLHLFNFQFGQHLLLFYFNISKSTLFFKCHLCFL